MSNAFSFLSPERSMARSATGTFSPMIRTTSDSSDGWNWSVSVPASMQYD
jgi:hypothetical protein